jgi:hypothetical protein
MNDQNESEQRFREFAEFAEGLREDLEKPWIVHRIEEYLRQRRIDKELAEIKRQGPPIPIPPADRNWTWEEWNRLFDWYHLHGKPGGMTLRVFTDMIQHDGSPVYGHVKHQHMRYLADKE